MPDPSPHAQQQYLLAFFTHAADPLVWHVAGANGTTDLERAAVYSREEALKVVDSRRSSTVPGASSLVAVPLAFLASCRIGRQVIPAQQAQRWRSRLDLHKAVQEFEAQQGSQPQRPELSPIETIDAWAHSVGSHDDHPVAALLREYAALRRALPDSLVTPLLEQHARRETARADQPHNQERDRD